VGDDLDVRVVDSRTITAGLGTLVTVAADMAAGGAGADDIVATVESMVARTHVIGALDTLDNLKKGGRIGGAQALLGSLLSIKPLLDISSGEVEEAGRARTRRKALEWLRDRIFEHPAVEHLCVAHGMAPDLEQMLALLSPRYGPDQIRVTLIGPTIGTHGGPRVMGLTWVDPA
jgi:DegV family protein with EDD domain